MSNLNPSLPDDLVPRRYQEEIFEQAQKGNVVAALNTGSGKTLISLLLIKWISAQTTSSGKVIIFLVPKVALVEQQGNFIAQNTPLRVLKLHGALDIDLTDRLRWQQRFAKHDVFVMTAQIFLNFLTHSIWSVDRVSLMIFDECHHTRKNHPYNGIMREYFEVNPSNARPKVFGMTASPIWDPKDAVGSLAQLEKNMDAKIIGVRAHIEELAVHSPKPVEIIKEHPCPLNEYNYPSPSLWMALGVFDNTLWDQLDIPWRNIGMRYYATLSNLGPYSASYNLYMELHQHISRLVKEYNSGVHLLGYDVVLDLPSKTPLNFLPPEFFIIRDIISDFEDFFSDRSPSHNIPVTVPLEWCTPKVKTLVDILLAYHSPTFQGIVFVEQRQVAACLARILPVIPELRGLIRSEFLVGQGVGNDGKQKLLIGSQANTVESFRKGDINILIATSVAEEGLDFPACDLVVRFDALQHMVGYVQSRGRARSKASNFVIMIQKDDVAHLARYQSLKEVEPEMNRTYQAHQDESEDGEIDENEETSPDDLAARERYVVPSSGAILTYDNSINLLSYLCALIPRDAFTPPHVPKFTGDFEATIHLPPNLPLSLDDRTFSGPLRRSKREARRAVAFKAVKRLHELEVFDQYLLPTTGAKGKANEDADGRAVGDVSNVPYVMDVTVRDPWTVGPALWMHIVHIDTHACAGLVTGTMLPPVELLYKGSQLSTTEPGLVEFANEEDEFEKRELMREFTKWGIWYRITARPLLSSPSLFLIPITKENKPDYDAMRRLIANPYGHDDWGAVEEIDDDSLLVVNKNEFARPRLLRRIRFDLTPMSKPPPGSVAANHPTYYSYFMNEWTRKKWTAVLPVDGPMAEAIILPRTFDGTYSLDPGKDIANPIHTVPDGIVAPRDSFRWIDISLNVIRAFDLLPPLCHRVSDIYRVKCAKFELGLPSIIDDLLVEALTIPSSNGTYSNQRLETLGDAVLEICTSVHVFNKYPHRHEGQLSTLRQSSISNRYLLARAKEIGLERFITSETQSVHIWRYVEPTKRNWGGIVDRTVSRCYPRRSLQDCMEAILGAAFLSGGIPTALHAGQALGLSFGGTLPWTIRYGRKPEASPASAIFSDLEDKLGYKFHRSELLLEAVTHPSFAHDSDVTSYQRLEFLGDALLDLVVVRYIYSKYPEATSHQLHWPKTRAVCSPALASLAVKRLDLHKIMLVNNTDLNKEIYRYVPILQATSDEDIVKRGWMYDPPKALSDVFESVIGAVLVDSAYNYERTAGVAEYVMKHVLDLLSPSLSRDPIGELLEWAAGLGCTEVKFEKGSRTRDGITSDGIVVLVHGVVVAGPIMATSLPVAKCMASERALIVLSDTTAEKSLLRLCICGKPMEAITLDEATEMRLVPEKIAPKTQTELDAASDLVDVIEVATILTQVDL